MPATLPFDPITATTLIYLGVLFALAGVGIFIYERTRKVKDTNLRVRYMSWYMIAPVVLIPCYFGDLVFAGLVVVLALYCLREFFGVVHVWQTAAYKWVGRISGTALVVSAYVDVHSHHPLGPDPFYVLPVFIIMLVLVIPVWLNRFEGMLRQEAFTILGILYFGWFLGHLVLLRNLVGGFGYVIFLSMAVVLNDVFAYSVGRLIGKTKLVPAISPGKTREGALGGLFGSLVAAGAFRYAVPELTWAQVFGAALLIGVSAPLGDLIVSVIKRDMAVKDSGNLIPGHGGLLDRCDSLIFATPVFYYYLRLVMHLNG